MILNHIAKKTKRSAQLIEYHIKQLIEEKIVICTTQHDKKYYILTDVFYDSSSIDALYLYLMPFVETLSETCLPETEPKDVVKTLGYILQLFIEDASKTV